MDEEERCPWCGEVAPAEEVGKGDKLDLRKWDMWLEGHVMDCEEWKKENGSWE